MTPQPGSTSPDDGFDEQRLLDELEQLQIAIRETRANGARAQTDFETQLRAFAAPAGSAAIRSEPGLPPVLAPGSVRAVDPPAAPPLQALVDDPAHAAEARHLLGGSGLRDAGSGSESARAPRAARSGLRLAVAAAGVTALVAVAGWLASRTPAPAQPAAPPAQQAPVEAPPAPPVKPVAPVDPHVLRIDLTTVRRVWLRVAVDGRIALEREVAAGEQLPFGADRAIAVRAGDAGAVTVRMGGVDQGPMGADGQVVTRAFAAPAR